MVEKCCNTCRHLVDKPANCIDLYFMCHRNNDSIFLFITNDTMTEKDTTRKLRSIGRNCKHWERKPI